MTAKTQPVAEEPPPSSLSEATIIRVEWTDERFVNVKFRFLEYEEDCFYGPFFSHEEAELFCLKRLSEGDDWSEVLKNDKGHVHRLMDRLARSEVSQM